MTRFGRCMNILGHSFYKNNGLIPIFPYLNILGHSFYKNNGLIPIFIL